MRNKSEVTINDVKPAIDVKSDNIPPTANVNSDIADVYFVNENKNRNSSDWNNKPRRPCSNKGVLRSVTCDIFRSYLLEGVNKLHLILPYV